MDFNLLLGNGSGIVMVLTDLQINQSYFNDFVRPILNEAAESSLAGYKEGVAHAMGIFENTANMRPKIEGYLRRVTRIKGTYNYNGLRFFFNQSLERGAALDLMRGDGGVSSLINHASTNEMTDTTDNSNLIDALIGGTDS